MSDEQVRALSATLSEARRRETLGRRPAGLTLEVVSEGPLRGKRFSFPDRTTLTGGRAKGHDVVLDDDSVSNTHFEIQLGPRGVLLRDLGSTNGTWVSRARLHEGALSLFDGVAFYAGNVKLRLVDIDVKPIARSTETTVGTMTGQSPAMAELFALMHRAGPTTITTLVTGETGTGKEEVARTLHQFSGRKGAFVVLDCGALPVGLAEAAIMGHVKGAFTGAINDTPGVFERANHGTLLIDEIGELPLELQPKLLRILDRHEVQRLGDTVSRPIDVRVVAATHRNVAAMVADDKFRLDLYHRLRQLTLHVPPLRDRPEDVALLVHRFLDDFERVHRTRVEIRDDALRLLEKLHWEGNVRQLKQTIERLAFLGDDNEITVEALRRFGDDDRLHDPRGGQVAAMMAKWLALPFKEGANLFQRYYFEALFEQAGGEPEEICRRSGYTRKGLLGLARRLGLPWPEDGG